MKKERFDITVLIVEDETDILEQLVKIVRRRVKHIFSAKNGEEALAIYKQESIDLIISDIDMPVMDGLTLLKSVREEDEDIAFILSTGLKSLDVLSTAIEYGITSFLPKPIQIDTLIKNIETTAVSVEARKKEEELSRLKNHFLANMSHEIRTPMNAIVGFTKLLNETELNEKQKKYVDIIDGSTHTLLGIVNDILDFSKLEAKKMELDIVDTDFFAEFKQIVELFRAKAEEKNIALKTEIDDDLQCCLKLDSLRFKQVMSNLISNAIKFTPEGENILVYAKILEKKDEMLRLHVGVKDSGIGISKEKQKHIFEAFSQADSSTTRKYGGSGLGLSISSDLISLMGGSLSLESEEEIGSDFFFDIELKICDKRIETAEKSGTKNPFNRFCRANILVVEDNALNQEYMSELLDVYHLDHKMADNGQQALTDLSKDHYDLILMDINMPVMGGTEAMKKIKELHITTPVVALTASAMDGDREKFLKEGFDDYLSKPVMLDELEKVFNTYLKTKDRYIDINALRSELEFSPGLVQRLLVIFLENYPKYLKNLKNAIDKKDFFSIEQSAHTLKGSASTIKMDRVKELSLELETAGKQHKAIDYLTKYEELSSTLEKVKSEILRLIEH